MRKSRFLLNLIAATAIGLSVFGCESSDTGIIQDASDIVNNGQAAPGSDFREYLLIGQRGLSTPFTLQLGATQSTPALAPGDVIATGTGDGTPDGKAQMYEIVGLLNRPQPNFNFLTPGAQGTEPVIPEEDEGLPGGYHGIYADPSGAYVIGLSRAKNRGAAGDEVTNAELQVYQLNIPESLETTYPPTFEFSTTADPTPIQVFNPNQGRFVSGAWSPNSRFFYAGIGSAIRAYSFDGSQGALTGIQIQPFPVGGAGVNNPAVMQITKDGRFLYAIDNANNTIEIYTIGGDGTLSNTGTVATSLDPRGFTIDRSGRYLYLVGRTSGALSGYRIGDDGSLTQIEVLDGFGAIATPIGAPLGDVDCNDQRDQMVLATYRGALQNFNIDLATGLLTPAGTGAQLLANARNTTNIEVEPTGQFVLSVQEHDFEELQDYVTVANGFPFPEEPIFANLDTATNTTAGGVYSPLAQTDLLGQIGFALPQPIANAFAGDVEAFRIQADGSLKVERRVLSENPYGLSFFTKTFIPPVPAGGGTTPPTP